MTTKGYSNRSNCTRAAKVALGKTAKPGTDFDLNKGTDGLWRWTPTGTMTVKDKPAPKAKSTKAKAKPAKAKSDEPRKRKPQTEAQRIGYIFQPQVAKALNLISHGNGRTVETLCSMLATGSKPLSPHQVRGLMSRCRTAGLSVQEGKVFRTVHYTVDADHLARKRKEYAAKLGRDSDGKRIPKAKREAMAA